jgi:hypothetical protein
MTLRLGKAARLIRIASLGELGRLVVCDAPSGVCSDVVDILSSGVEGIAC